MRLGSLFSGAGCLDLAVEHALGAATVWQVEQDPHACRVLRRHFPGALLVEGDVAAVDPSTLPAIDVLCGGFPCTDLSTAGSGAGLDGERSGLYVHLVRFAAALRPERVIIENVPRLLSRYRQRIEADWRALGYGCTWRCCSAAAAGAPHLRRRVFVDLRLGGRDGGVLALPDGGVLWPTPTASNPNEQESEETWRARSEALVARGSSPLSPPLGLAVRMWPTQTRADAAASGSRNTASSAAHPGESLTDALREDGGTGRRWSSPAARDNHGGKRAHTKGGRSLADDVLTSAKTRLNPEFHCALMGLPPDWTADVGPSRHAEALALLTAPRWPALRGLPQHDWEPPRLVEGPPTPGRPARLRASGNAVVPQACVLALQFEPKQRSIFSEVS